ncbi:MAG: SpaA isopeptide-forming pilin-related protein, partial [Acutalibacteraceae bacterium]|nr:SpaA isopeptide-forming pilin-related protein [Acutalibacteraceae bacterium]
YSDKACTKLLETLPATDSKGNAVTVNTYRPGTYYLKEITPPAYYELSNEVLTIKITNADATAGTVVKKTASDILIPVYVRVYKTDEETNKPLSGAVFGLYSNKSCTDGYLLEEITTGSNGYGKSAKAYPPGTYYLKERKAPSGFKLDNTVITVTLSKQTSAGKVITVNRTNPPLEVKLSLYKKDKDTKEAIAGAVYGLYSDSACKNLLESVTIKDNGVGTTADTYRTGTYYWKEIAPPKNYELSDEVIPVTISVTDVIKGVPVKSTAYDEKKSFHLIVVKYDADSWSVRYGLGGAVIGVYEDKECKKLIEELKPTADDSGETKSTQKYKIGDTVYLKEHKEPYGYQKRTDIVKLEITESMVENSTAIYGYEVIEHKYWNRANPSYIGVIKKDSKTGQLLAGASFMVSDTKDVSYPKYGYITTDENGYGQNKSSLQPGKTYYLRETSAPTNYLLPNTVYEVFVDYTDEYGKVVVIEIENDPKDTPITIRKTCSTTKLPVAGATYRAYSSNAKDSNGMLLDKNVICEEFVTGSDGMAKIPVMFAVGEVFYVQEYKAPDTHSLSKTITKVTVVEDMDVIEVTDSPKTGGAYILKTDADGNPMQGVKFEVYRKSDNKKIQLYTISLSANLYAFSEYGTSSAMTYTPVTGANGKIELVSFPIGEYYLLEVGGADGYMPYGTKIPFIVEVDPNKPTTGTKVEIEIANHLPIIWNTGGMGTSGFYTTTIIALAISLIALSLFTARTAKKLKKSN